MIQITASNVAKILGVQPSRVHQLAIESAKATPSDRVERLRLLPPNTNPPQGYRTWDVREVLRCRAYREGGTMAARAEAQMVRLHGVGATAAANDAAFILGYPETPEFCEWLSKARDTEGAAL